MTGKPRQERPSHEAKKAITQHLWRHHERASFFGDAQMRMQAHDDLHHFARQDNRDLGHTHLPYQDGETDTQMAARLLAEGTTRTTE